VEGAGICGGGGEAEECGGGQEEREEGDVSGVE